MKKPRSYHVRTLRFSLLLPISFFVIWSSGAAEPTGTNAHPHWLPLKEVRQRWGQTSLEAIHQAAEGGEVTAQHYLGYCYSYGERVSTNGSAAVKWYERAGSSGYAPSFYNLALLYEQGNLIPADAAKAFDLYHQAAEQGLPAGMHALYRSYWEGNVVAEDREQALQWLTKAAEAGHALSQCELGHHLEYPSRYDVYPIVKKPNSMPDAVRWYRLAASQGWAGGQYHLGLCYLAGKGVEKDEEHGLELIRTAADQGHAPSLIKLSELYARGIGEPRSNADRPIRLLLRAAEQDSGEVCQALTFRYKHGLGTDRDLVAAAKWHCRAARFYPRRFPLKRNPTDSDKTREDDDFSQVLSVYLAAANLDGKALEQIGRMYLTGKHVPKSSARAWPWLSLASQHGGQGAGEMVAQAQSNMNGEELKGARIQLAELTGELRTVNSIARSIARAGQ